MVLMPPTADSIDSESLSFFVATLNIIATNKEANEPQSNAVKESAFPIITDKLRKKPCELS